MQRTMDKFVYLILGMTAFAFVLLTPRAQCQTEKIIYSFAGGADGLDPVGGVLLESNGNIYGVTELDNTGDNSGTVYELSPGSGGIWTKTVLHSFTVGTNDVFFPCSNLVSDVKGNLYGIAPEGGLSGSGGVFELSPGSNGIWTEKVIYSFTGGLDTVGFSSYLTIDSAGNLYGYRQAFLSTNGTTSSGGIFQLQANSSGTWTENILHTFSGGNDGSAVYGGRLIVDAAGNVYGQASNGPLDFGLVFELVHGSNGNWTEKNLHTFLGGSDGASMSGSLAIDAKGNIFGTSTWNAFELVPGSNGTWTEKILHTFGGGKDGAYPESGLTISASGTLYGTTYEGGSHYGTVFQIVPQANGTWTETVLHRFTPTGGDGIYPFYSPLALDVRGNAYGITSDGGVSNNGVVFEVTP